MKDGIFCERYYSFCATKVKVFFLLYFVFDFGSFHFIIFLCFVFILFYCILFYFINIIFNNTFLLLRIFSYFSIFSHIINYIYITSKRFNAFALALNLSYFVFDNHLSLRAELSLTSTQLKQKANAYASNSVTNK